MEQTYEDEEDWLVRPRLKRSYEQQRKKRRRRGAYGQGGSPKRRTTLYHRQWDATRGVVVRCQWHKPSGKNRIALQYIFEYENGEERGEVVKKVEHNFDVRQFRFILAPADDHVVTKEYVEKVVDRWEKHLGYRLNWSAVIHDDSNSKHAHIIIDGESLDKEEIFLDNNFRLGGSKAIAEDVAWELHGDPSSEELLARKRKQVKSIRFNEIDQWIHARLRDGVFTQKKAIERGGIYEWLMVMRLEFLTETGLIKKVADNKRHRWSVPEDFKEVITKEQAQRDITRTLYNRTEIDYKEILKSGKTLHGIYKGTGLVDEQGNQPYIDIEVDGKVQRIKGGVSLDFIEKFKKRTKRGDEIQISTKTIKNKKTGRVGGFLEINRLPAMPKPITGMGSEV